MPLGQPLLVMMAGTCSRADSLPSAQMIQLHPLYYETAERIKVTKANGLVLHLEYFGPAVVLIN